VIGGCYRCAEGGCTTHPGDTHGQRDGTITAPYPPPGSKLRDAYHRLDGCEVFSEVVVSKRKTSFFKLNGEPNPHIVRRAAKRSTMALAKKLRKQMTPSEIKVWRRLHAMSLRFRRQSVVLGWIADFYHPKSRLVVEIDGGYHQNPEQQGKDRYRDATMQRHGFRVIRITNEQVESDFERVIAFLVEQSQSAISSQPNAAEPEACGRSNQAPRGLTGHGATKSRGS
jgi:very-short-patch-repair endonuclease